MFGELGSGSEEETCWGLEISEGYAEGLGEKT